MTRRWKQAKKGKPELLIVVETMNRIRDRCQEGFLFPNACKMIGISPAAGEQWRRASRRFNEEIEKVLATEYLKISVR